MTDTKTSNILRQNVLAFLWAGLLVIGLTAAESAGQDLDKSSLAKKVETEILKTMLNAQIPSAAAALVSGEEIVWQGAYGNTNVWGQTPAFPNSVYLIGSTFKTMSTFALLQLMEQGKFSLDDPVNGHLSEFKISGEPPGNPVTFRHLLTHTSGLPADFGPCPVWSYTAPLPLRSYLERSLLLKAPPLSGVIYSNIAYTLVAYLVEKLSGIPYKQYIQENIFNPLEMDDTAFEPRPDMVERLAIPYYFDTKTKNYVAVGWSKANVWPAGIVYGTVLNQANWLIANLNRGVFKGRRLIGEKTLQEVMTRQYDQFAGPLTEGWLNETTGYGLTWWISELAGEKLFAHSGSVLGYTAFLIGNLDRKTGFAVLTNGNRAHRFLFSLGQQALEILADELEAARQTPAR
jgi:CubicO group peptidase (beta-lactamase class C family)